MVNARQQSNILMENGMEVKRAIQQVQEFKQFDKNLFSVIRQVRDLQENMKETQEA